MNTKFHFDGILSNTLSYVEGLPESALVHPDIVATTVAKFKINPPELIFKKVKEPEVKIGSLGRDVPAPPGRSFHPGIPVNYLIFRIPVTGDTSMLNIIISESKYYIQHYSIGNGELVYKHYEESIISDSEEKLISIKTIVKKTVEDFDANTVKPLAAKIADFNADLTTKIEERIAAKKAQIEKRKSIEAKLNPWG